MKLRPCTVFSDITNPRQSEWWGISALKINHLRKYRHERKYTVHNLRYIRCINWRISKLPLNIIPWKSSYYLLTSLVSTSFFSTAIAKITYWPFCSKRWRHVTWGSPRGRVLKYAWTFLELINDLKSRIEFKWFCQREECIFLLVYDKIGLKI